MSRWVPAGTPPQSWPRRTAESPRAPARASPLRTAHAQSRRPTRSGAVRCDLGPPARSAGAGPRRRCRRRAGRPPAPPRRPSTEQRRGSGPRETDPSDRSAARQDQWRWEASCLWRGSPRLPDALRCSGPTTGASPPQRQWLQRSPDTQQPPSGCRPYSP